MSSIFDLNTFDYDYVYLFAKIAITTVIIITLMILIPMTILKKETYMVTQRTVLFIMETLIAGAGPAILLMFFTLSRTIPYADARMYALKVGISFALLHVLFQISGFYKYLIGGV
jgi:hypothetical protein